jgi:glucose-1-phosphate cytidylyltransferase
MNVVVLAGGLGTRLAEETGVKPKPMVEIGGRPILWHILQHYAHHGFRDFYIALGYKGDQIKRYFLDYRALASDLTLSLSTGELTLHGENEPRDDWRLHLIDTGATTNTGGRLRRLARHLQEGTFLLTYGDGVADVDLRALVDFHRAHGKLATVTAVRPPSRFGGLVLEGNLVREFNEKPQIGEGWINGGYMAFEPGALGYVEGDGTSLEADALEALARDGQLAAYRHTGFWQCMDTLREVHLLERLWATGAAPWKVW